VADIADVTMRSVEYALSGLQVRADVRANNIANAETPGFQANRVSFSDQLAGALSSSNPRDALGDLEGPEIQQRDNLPNAQNNTVQLVQEMTEMTKDNLLQDAMVNSYNYKVGLLRTAIRGQAGA
jgi:flagellar basal-body rod protein FlgB